MCGRYKIALYTVLQSAVDGEILLLPVRVCHVENAVTYTLIYSSAAKTFKAITFVNVARVLHSHSCLQR